MGGDLTVPSLLGDTLSIGSLAVALGTLFVVGAAPVFAVRLFTVFYPKGDPRRAELVAEMAHVAGIHKLPERFLWLGQVFATAVCEGWLARRDARQDRRRATPSTATEKPSSWSRTVIEILDPETGEVIDRSWGEIDLPPGRQPARMVFRSWTRQPGDGDDDS